MSLAGLVFDVEDESCRSYPKKILLAGVLWLETERVNTYSLFECNMRSGS
jgi:hypothetical protein